MVDDAQAAVGVERADVAGVNPTVGVDQRAGRVRAPVVARSDRGAAHERFGVVGEPQFEARGRPPDRAPTSAGSARVILAAPVSVMP